MIDPSIQQVIDGMTAAGFRLPQPMTAQAMRAALDNPAPSNIVVAEVRDLQFAGPAEEIATRLYHPEPGKTLPLVVFLHGGGWVIGTLDTHDALARALAQGSGCAVLSVAYRLAPEHPYPAAFEDCLAVLAQLPARASELGVDAARYAVAGDSAGGNLATVLALKLRGQANAPTAQLLLYPVTDRDFATHSYLNAFCGDILTRDEMRFFWDCYIGDAVPDAFAAPLRATDLSGMPATTIMLAGNDPLHDEGFAYALRLRDAGVPVDLHDFSGAVHGIASFGGISPLADQIVDIGANALRRALTLA